MDRWAKNNSEVTFKITKITANYCGNINELVNMGICNIQFDVSFKALVAINLFNIDRYYIVQN